ncbi:hypothetical protein [Streptomyces sp. 184]|uniref:hypothetical protein n=1 Tax=Streptomyces sp. 184 TaxID=1827526 RepID=UPI0038927789
MSARPHGYARYRLDGCRCYVCGYAKSVYEERRTKAITAGTWQPYTDAEPVRAHIRDLRTCGMGLRRIADVANVERQRLTAIVNGRPEHGTPPQARVRPHIAAAVLAVEPTLDNLAPSTPVPAIGTHRRLQALVYAGWPQARLAARLGTGPGNFTVMMTTGRVIVRTARAAAAVYDELWQADPREHGVGPPAYSRARSHARARGWAPVVAWDDDTIDDPAAVPDWTGQCGTPAGYWAHRRSDEVPPACQPCRAAHGRARRERDAERRTAVSAA